MGKKLSKEQIREILGPFATMGHTQTISEMDRNLALAKGRLSKLKNRLSRD